MEVGEGGKGWEVRALRGSWRYGQTPEFRMKIKRPLYCPDEVFLAGCVERGGGLPEYDKDSVIITNIKVQRTSTIAP